MSINKGTHYAPVEQWSSQFGSNSWDLKKHPRKLTDVNGDGYPDIVGFHDNDVYVAINEGDKFGSAVVWKNGWGASSWDHNFHIREVIDVNGDGLNDLIGFHYNKVYVAINSGSDFGDTETWINGWGADTWSLDHNIRRVVDVNGDALPDLIGLSANNVYFSKNRRKKPYIEEITEPLGIKYFISYGSLPNSSAYSSSGTLEEYPNPEIASPTYLVEYFEVEQPGEKI